MPAKATNQIVDDSSVDVERPVVVDHRPTASRHPGRPETIFRGPPKRALNVLAE